MSTDAAKPEFPKALAAVPIVLTILATVFAGLSSSEMTRSMYFRSLAAQYQAKAGAQWGFFQAKKMRGSMLDVENDIAQLLSVRPIGDKFAANLREQLAIKGENIKGLAEAVIEPVMLLDQEPVQAAIGYLTSQKLPASEEPPAPGPPLSDLLAAIRNRATESKTADLVGRITPVQIDAAIEQMETAAASFETACEPITRSIKSLMAALDKLRRYAAERYPGEKALAPILESAAGLRVAQQDFTARRYDREAKYNQQIGELFEVQVRRAGFDSERHRIRSKNFFYAMLCAQAGVTIASLALAKARQSAIWLMAALAGLLAIGIGGYVYLAM